MLALWAAERLGKLGLAGEGYAIAATNVASPSPLSLEHIMADVSEQEVHRVMDRLLAQAHAGIGGSVF